MDKKQGSRFVADLGDIKLSEESEKVISAEIQRIVLQELAKLDFKGDITLRKSMHIETSKPGHTDGIWINSHTEV